MGQQFRGQCRSRDIDAVVTLHETSRPGHGTLEEMRLLAVQRMNEGERPVDIAVSFTRVERLAAMYGWSSGTGR